MQEKTKKNTEISERISKLIDYLGVTANEFAKKLNYERSQTIYDIINAKSAPSFDFFQRFFNTEYSELINHDWLFAGKGEMIVNNMTKTVQPILSNSLAYPLLELEAFAGVGDSFTAGTEMGSLTERFVIPSFEGVHIDFMIKVRGSSMYPKYNSGDVVACRLIKEILYLQWNKVYVIDTFSNGVMIKRLKKGDDEATITLKSDNKDYDDFNIPKTDIRNIALVVGVIRLE
jgi:hypothetical protein